MSGTIKPIALTFTASNQASPVIAKLNQQISAMGAPAAKFNKAIGQFGNTNGVNALGQSMQALSGKTFEVFRSLDRVSPLMAGITGAASLYGMTQMVQRWGELGQKVANAGQRLGIPTDRLTALQGAARLAGSSAEDLTAGLGSLDTKLRGALFHGDQGARALFTQLHVGMQNADGSARSAADAFGDVAEGIKDLYAKPGFGRGAALQAAQSLGLDGLLPLLLKGKKGIQELQAEAANHGVVISPEAAENAAKLNKSFTAVIQSAEGLGNSIADKLSGPVGTLNAKLSKWLDTNRDIIAVDVAGWVSNLGAAINGLDTKRFDALIGAAIGYKLGGLRGALVGATGGFLYGSVGQPTEIPIDPGAKPADGTVRGWWGNHAPTWLGGNSAGPEGRPIRTTGNLAADRSLPPEARALLDTIAGPESGGDYSLINGGRHFSGLDHPNWKNPDTNSTAAGRYMDLGSTWDIANKAAGGSLHFGSPVDQDRGNWALAAQTYHDKMNRDLLNDLRDPSKRGLIQKALGQADLWTTLNLGGYDANLAREQGADSHPRLADPFASMPPTVHPLAIPPPAAQGPLTTTLDGKVQVEVTMPNAPPGTRVKTQSSGQVDVAPPSIGMPMSGVAGDYHRGY